MLAFSWETEGDEWASMNGVTRKSSGMGQTAMGDILDKSKIQKSFLSRMKVGFLCLPFSIYSLRFSSEKTKEKEGGKKWSANFIWDLGTGPRLYRTHFGIFMYFVF